jgi:hypothetical protein
MADISDLPAPPKGPSKADISDLPAPPRQPSFGEKALEFVEPTVEALGTAGGAILGTPLGPAGTVGGAGLGYGISREAMQLAREKLGYAQPRTTEQLVTEPLRNIVTGATMETGGRLAGRALEKLSGKGAELVGGFRDFFKPEVRAGKIAREALGQDLAKARQVLSQAADDLSTSQALASIDPKTGKPVLNAPAAQALLQRAASRDPKFFSTLLGEQEAARLQQLQRVAGGSDQTAARAAQEEMKRLLNERLIPVLETELGAANIAGKLAPKFESEAGRMGEAAAAKVQDVRRFTAAGERAVQNAKKQMSPSGLPVPVRYTYMGELADRAERVATQAAEGSLRFGEAKRFAEAARQSLGAHGLRPLESAPVVARIGQKLRDPSLAGNVDVERSLTRVASDISKWTNGGGVIDAFALDSIRKNSVNAAIKELYPTADAKAQKALAAKVLETIRPVIIDAVEEAGGTGYRQYLRDYSLGMQRIAQNKLGAEALQIYQTNPKAFVDLVEGNAPEVVERIFGAGNYNFAKEMSLNAQQALRKVAGEVKRGEAIKEQATLGEKRLSEILKEHAGTLRLPSFLSVKVTTTNALLDALENRLSKKTLGALTEAAKSAQNFERLINTLPAAERGEVLKALRDPATFREIQRKAGGAIAGVSDRDRSVPPPSGAAGINDMSPRLGGR